MSGQVTMVTSKKCSPSDKSGCFVIGLTLIGMVRRSSLLCDSPGGITMKKFDGVGVSISAVISSEKVVVPDSHGFDSYFFAKAFSSVLLIVYSVIRWMDLKNMRRS